MPYRLSDTSACTLALEDRDYPEWHRGREHYGIWLIDADTAPLHARIERARDHLAPWLSPHRRAPHITLYVCGFLAAPPVHDDDFGADTLARQLEALTEARLPAFTLGVGGLDSFDSAAFLRVDDPDGALDAIRSALGSAGAEVRQAPYLPHLTVGLYGRAVDKTELRQRLDTFADAAPMPLPMPFPIPLPVTRLRFARYAARDLGGALHTVGTVELGC